MKTLFASRLSRLLNVNPFEDFHENIAVILKREYGISPPWSEIYKIKPPNTTRLEELFHSSKGTKLCSSTQLIEPNKPAMSVAARMQMGIDFEGPILQQLHTEHRHFKPLKLKKRRIKQISSEFNLLGIVDGFAQKIIRLKDCSSCKKKDYIIEVKTRTRANFGCKLQEFTQIQAYMYLFDIKRCLFVESLGGDLKKKLNVSVFKYNSGFVNEMMKLISELVEELQTAFPHQIAKVSDRTVPHQTDQGS